MTPARKTPRGPAPTLRPIAPSYHPRQVEKTPPCQSGCPNCGDIRGWIGTVAQRAKLGLSREDAYERAWRIITDVNPFPSTLGRICPHPCETHCNRNQKDEPLAINALERFLGDFAIDQQLQLSRKRSATGGACVGVIGAGPSGLSFAYQLARRGHRVTVYDARDQAGGMLRYGVPDYRLPQDVLDAEIARIVNLGVELRLGVRVGRDVSLQDLRARYDGIYLGIGAQEGRALRIPGAEGKGVMIGTDYLAAVNQANAPELGEHVLVIGGGNSAIDAARSARRQGASVTIVYRRTLKEMPASQHEVDDALAEGVQLLELSAPLEIRRDSESRPREMLLQRMRLGATDASGRRGPVPVAGSEFTLPARTVVMAISQRPLLNGLSELDHSGDWLIADASGTVSENVYAGGDVLGLGIAGNAIVQGRRAAESLHARLGGGVQEDPSLPRPGIGPESIKFESREASAATRKPELPPRERVSMNMAEVSGNISEQAFLAETQRCFSCGSCFGCEQCQMYCTKGCFIRVEEPEPGMYFTLNLDQCQACGKCVEVCPCGFLDLTQS